MGLKVKLVKSFAGSNEEQLATISGLGLKKLGQERILQDSPSVRGMIFKVQHLVSHEVVKENPVKRQRMKPRHVRAKAAKAQAQK